jgi:predicted DNA binding CopG/RHH family protein
MTYFEPDKEEQKILDDLEKGKLKSAPNLKERKQSLQKYAKNTLNKTKNINIRLSERDLHKLKAKAIEEGIPYQTLASSILHKAAAK